MVLKLIGPLLGPSGAARPATNWRFVLSLGFLLLSLILLDQFLLGRFA